MISNSLSNNYQDLIFNLINDVKDKINIYNLDLSKVELSKKKYLCKRRIIIDNGWEKDKKICLHSKHTWREYNLCKLINNLVSVLESKIYLIEQEG